MAVVEALTVLAATLMLAVSLGYPTLWFVVPFAVISLGGRRYEDYGLQRGRPGGVAFHAAVIGLVLGGYALGHYLFARLLLGQTFTATLPDAFARTLLEQVLVVGLSEEFFFRGYLQSQLNRQFGRPWRFLGAPFGWGLVLAAVLFGLCHLVTGPPTQLKVIFFGLFAGWLRERTETIYVPAVYHGVSNCLYFFMAASME